MLGAPVRDKSRQLDLSYLLLFSAMFHPMLLICTKGKLPYLEDGDTKLRDSQFIIWHLKTNNNDLDKGLNKTELALSLAMQRLLEEHLFWATMYSRWRYTDTNWQVTKKAILG